MKRTSTPYVRPLGRPIKPPLWQRVVTTLMAVALILLLIALFAITLVEWAAGCGETYVDANGVRHQYECVFIPQRKEQQ